MSRARTLSDIIATVPAAVRWKLDEEIDFEHRDGRGLIIPKHLGRIADVILDRQDVVADHLGLTDTDRNDIVERYRDKPKLQRREALSRWKSGLGKAATYRALIQIFFQAGKVDCAEFVCDLFKDNSGDLGVDSTTPTTVSHAQSASATTTTTAAIDFSESLGPSDLAHWLRQEYGADYGDDVEKLCKAKINGKRLLNNISALNSKYKLELSVGFLEEIEERAGQLKGPATAGVTPPTGGNSAASRPPTQHTPPSSTQTQHNATALSHQSLIEQLGIHAPKWKEIGTYLGFHQPELRLIETSPVLLMGAPGTWFSAMLEAWLQWEPGDKRGSKERASLESLKTAVDKVGLGRTAAELHY